MSSWLQQYLNSAKMTEAGPLDLLDVDSDSDKEDLNLPGVLKGGHLLGTYYHDNVLDLWQVI